MFISNNYLVAWHKEKYITIKNGNKIGTVIESEQPTYCAAVVT